MKKIIYTITVIALVLIAIWFIARKEGVKTYDDVSLDTFAQCLATKGMTMYGADWCPHCKKEKALFGSSFKYVPYVECPDNVQLCLSKGIDSYPTWIDATGTSYKGQQGIERVSQISGCQI